MEDKPVPFKPMLLDSMPSPKPDVEIFFHGQLLLRSEDGTACEVGVNPNAAGHVLTVEARTKTPGKLDLINMKHIGLLHFRQPEGMTIEITDVGQDDPPPPAAWKCITLDPIDYTEGVGAPDEDFRWMLNLEGRLFHQKKLKPNIFGTQHVIKLQGGEYFFQTALRMDRRIILTRTGGGLGDLKLKGAGAIARASVFLVEDQSVVLRWNDGSKERTLTLTKSKDSTYEIYIENTPLFVEVDPLNLSKHEELNEYYKVIREISSAAPRAKFSLIPSRDPAALRESGSPSIPCQAMTLDGPLS
jgi:hypothetical protein